MLGQISGKLAGSPMKANTFSTGATMVMVLSSFAIFLTSFAAAIIALSLTKRVINRIYTSIAGEVF